MPLLAVGRPRRQVAGEREQRLVRLGEIEGVLQGAPGGVRVGERVAGDGPGKNAAATQT
jgi:hypothetical protein